MSRSLSPRRVKSDTEAFDTPTKRNSKKDDAILTPKSVKNAVKEKVTPGKDKDIKDKETTLTPAVKSTTVSTPQQYKKAIPNKLQFVDEAEVKIPSPLRENAIKVNPRVDHVYKLIRKGTGTLGGNGYDGAIYGELTAGSMQKVINFMIDRCELTNSSRFIDVGSGLGKPNFHAAQDPCVRLSIGVELETIRWQLAMYNFLRILPETLDNDDPTVNADIEDKLFGNTNFIVADIDQAVTLDPFTHIYMYDLGFPPPLQQSIARKFNTSHHARYLVSYRQPHRVIDEYGYSVEFIGQINTSMHGSGENHMAYFYRRIAIDKDAFVSTSTLTLPARHWIDGEKEEVVHCDVLFKEASTVVLGSLDKFKKVVRKINETNSNAARPKRERKPVRKV